MLECLQRVMLTVSAHILVCVCLFMKQGRPEHGGRDRHFCIAVTDTKPIEERLDDAGVPYTKSKSGRPAIFFRDPDMNTIEAAVF